MRVAVLGGTGVVGRYAAQSLAEAGHTVETVSRSNGVDAYSGAGLDEALAGVEVVVDTLNTTAQRRKVAEDFFVTTSRRLQAAAATAGVQHVVLLSIIGIDRVRGFAYYDAKRAQEQTAMAGPVPTTVLRAAQFHEFPAQLLTRLRLGPVAVVPHMRSQPVAASTVGDQLARLSTERPGGTVELAGPQVHDIADLARQFVAARGERLRVLPVSLPGKAGHDMRGDALLATSGTILAGPSFEDWLHTDAAQRIPLSR